MQRKRTSTKSLMITLFLFVAVSQGYLQGQTIEGDLSQVEMELPNISEMEDWKYLDHMKNVLCKPPHQCNWLDNANLWEYIKYVDDLQLNKSLLAASFLDKYPDSPNYDQALSLFLSSFFRPKFISKQIDSTVVNIISELPRKGSAEAWFKAYRLLPIDFEAKDRWLKKGNEYVAKIVNSGAPLERKARFEQALYNRDIGMALNMFYYLPKETIELDYWKSMERPYWDAMWERLLHLMDKYPNSEQLAKYVMTILNEFKKFSPEQSMTYMEEALSKSSNDDRKGLQALHKSISDYLKGSEELASSSDLKPLDMTFVDMEGNKIDLSEMRGKVVLVDFWSISCPPCIAEMPHVKAMYDKYREQGFEVIGIVANGDGAKEQVDKILEKTKANWPQRLDTGKDASVSYHSLYNITSLPTVWLLDKDGIIVDRQARGERLEPLIRKYLGLDN